MVPLGIICILVIGNFRHMYARLSVYCLLVSDIQPVEFLLTVLPTEFLYFIKLLTKSLNILFIISNANRVSIHLAVYWVRVSFIVLIRRIYLRSNLHIGGIGVICILSIHLFEVLLLENDC